MSSSNGSPVGHFSGNSTNGCCMKGNWSGMNIAVMVVAFVIFWPLGLVVLYWNIKGRDIKDLPSAAKEKWTAMFNSGKGGRFDYSSSENSVFNEYQQTQHDRINEIKEEIKNRAGRFNIFRSDAKRREDEKEFNDFMSNKPESDSK